MSLSELVNSWLSRDETKTLEYKRIKGAELTKILRSLTAFANTDGGLLVLGMEDLSKAQGTDRLFGIEENEPAVDDLRREMRTRILPNLGGELGPDPVFRRVPCTLRDGRPGHLVAIEIRPSRDLHSIAEGGTWERLRQGQSPALRPRDHGPALPSGLHQRGGPASGSPLRVAGHALVARLSDGTG